MAGGAIFRAMFLRVAFLLAALLAAQDSRAFVFYRIAGNLLRWNVNAPGLQPSSVNPTTKAIRYYIASDAYTETNKTAEIDAVRACFDQWQIASGGTLRFEFAGTLPPQGLDVRFDNTNVVFWTKNNLRVAAGTEDLSGRRAWTSVTFTTDGNILDADIVMNAVQFKWYTDYQQTSSPYQFIEATMSHEIGHFIGLDHTPAGAGTVVDGSNGVSTEVGLSQDEIAALRYLYPTNGTSLGSIGGTVRLNGSGVLGAMVIIEDSHGNIAGATVSDANGVYLVPSLAAGEYRLRVCPFAPYGSTGLLRAEEIAADYRFAPTAFQPTTNFVLTVTSNQTRTQDVVLTSGEPAIRILTLSAPNPDPSYVTSDRYGVTIPVGASNYYTGLISRGFKSTSKLSITGDGLTVGPTQFLENRFGLGLHALLVSISVSGNATPGLRSYVVTDPSGLAYANGYLEVAPSVPDINWDGLDDRFQRAYWSPWTTAASAPSADPDGDLFSNAYEFRTGTNPTNALSGFLRLDPLALGRFSSSLSWPADLGKRYQLQGSETLGNWQAIGPVITATNETMTVLDPERGGRKFYRLQLLP